MRRGVSQRSRRLGRAVGLGLGLASVTLACTRLNPSYCDPEHPCGVGLVCQADHNACVPEGDCTLGGCACDGPADCPATTAACVAGLCEPCTSGDLGDAVCQENDPTTPICGDGRCVECAVARDCVGDVRPHCDLAAGRCVPCQGDDECSAGVCDEDAGACLTEAALIHVAIGGDDLGPCSRERPCGSVAAALAQVVAARATIVVHGDPAPFVETITFDAAAFAVAQVTLVGAVGQRPSFLPSPDQAGLDVQGVGARLAVERLELRDSNRAGVRCRQATLRLDDVTIRGHEALGVDAADGCDIVLERSRILDNHGGGVSLVGVAGFGLANDVIAGNGDGSGASRGGVVVEGATGTVEFCTIAANQVSEGTRAAGIDCLGGLALASNILWDNRHSGSSLQDNAGGTCVHRHSIVGGTLAGALDGGDNASGDPLLDGTFHLASGSPAVDTADPAATLAVDIDGDARPSGGGRDIGADERTP